MNEKQTPQMLNENDLSDVSGGGMEYRLDARHSVGQTIRFCHFEDNSKETLVYHTPMGTIVEIISEPEGIFYRVELDEQGRQVVGSSHIIISIENVIDF